MSEGEFDIIDRYFKRLNPLESGVVIGIGDDCAILDISAGHQLAVTTDTLVSGVHFFEDVDPYRLGYKALAVNLSDLAAMGATAKWASLAITLPDVNEPWLAEFCRGFFELADKYQVQLVGGDTTKGPLSITVSAKGIVPTGQALTRSHAQVDDVICVSGYLGDGALGLAAKLSDTKIVADQQPFIDALELTEPRLTLGQQLIDHASSCIDLSDGLSQDLMHILKKSDRHAQLHLEHLPLSEAILTEIDSGHLSLSEAWQYAVTGGDDYELLFTISKHKLASLRMRLSEQGLSLNCFEIGVILDPNNSPLTGERLGFTHLQQPVTLEKTGWDHFK